MKKIKLNKVLIGVISVIGLSLITGCSTDSDTIVLTKEEKMSSIKTDKLDTANVNLPNEQVLVEEFVRESGAVFQLRVPNLEQAQLDFLEEVVYPIIDETVKKYNIQKVEILTVDLDTDSEGLLKGVVRTFATNEQGDTDQTLSIQDNKVVLYYDGSFNDET